MTTTRRSLRWHLGLGALLWTVGLFAVAGVVMTHMIERQPLTPHLVHLVFRQALPVGLFAVLLLLVGLVQVRRGVSPIGQLRHKLSAVHGGHARQIDGDFPSEVEPLVTDLNMLLDHQQEAIARAQGKAGDLAHGLKTPLAVLARDAAAAESAGQIDLAASIRLQVDRMQRQIDYHLAHARAAASGATPAARCVLADSVDGLIRTVNRIYAERHLKITGSVPASFVVRAERQDVDEMIGNLIDNACKWAARHVAVGASVDGASIVITIDDDGPGIPADLRTDVFGRGVRADQAAAGSGFGLAIARELAALYGGSVRLDVSPASGTRAILTLPSV